MKKAPRIKSKAAQFAVPQTREQASEYIRRIGEAQRERARIEADMNDEIAAIKERHELQAQPHAQAIIGLSEAVKTYAEAHRGELTDGGKRKTVELAAGRIKWRLPPPSVSVRKAVEVIAALKDLGLQRFVRVKEEVNKDAILDDPDAVQHVKGISITQREDFVVEPYETELEQVA